MSVLPDGTVAKLIHAIVNSVLPGELLDKTVRKLPIYPLLSAPLLCRLAIDRRQEGKGFGRFLVADALYRTAMSEAAFFRGHC